MLILSVFQNIANMNITFLFSNCNAKSRCDFSIRSGRRAGAPVLPGRTTYPFTLLGFCRLSPPAGT